MTTTRITRLIFQSKKEVRNMAELTPEKKAQITEKYLNSCKYLIFCMKVFGPDHPNTNAARASYYTMQKVKTILA